MLEIMPFLLTVSINDLRNILEELVGVCNKWYEVGLRLNMPPGTLDTFKHLEPRISMREILACWLRGTNPPPTWEALADALESRTVGETALAQQLRSKYCTSVTGM